MIQSKKTNLKRLNTTQLVKNLKVFLHDTKVFIAQTYVKVSIYSKPH